MHNCARRNASLGLLAMAVLSLLVAGCAGGPPRAVEGPSVSPETAAKAARAGDYVKATRLYSRLARSASKPGRRARWRLKAGQNAYRADNLARSRELLAGIDAKRFDTTDRALYELLAVQLRTAGQPPEARLRALPRPTRQTPDTAAARIWAARARAQIAADRPLAAMQSLIERGALLTAERARYANQQKIYDVALTADGVPRDADVSRPVRGWLRLTMIAERSYPGPAARKRALSAWVSTFPNHPANGKFLAEALGFNRSWQERARRLANNDAAAGTSPPASRQVALVLPLTGRYASAANAIRAGYLFAAGRSSRFLPAPLVWNATRLDPGEITARAASRDVGVIVGPLRKSSVTALAGRLGSVRVIALNRSTRPVVRRNFYQFGLAPGDAARTAARRALANLGHRALALAPRTERGKRILKAFRTRFRQGGGAVVASAGYQAGGDDHGNVIGRLLGGYNSIRGINPRRIDFIFVAATPRQGRLIRSQLDYHHATNLPMVATGLIYSATGGPQRAIDLNGVYFVDMPWRIGRGDKLERLRQAATSRYPEATSYSRLFALGIDSYRLAARMVERGLGASSEIDGATGYLTIDSDDVIHRELAWARFFNGQPKLLATPDPSARVIRQ